MTSSYVIAPENLPVRQDVEDSNIDGSDPYKPQLMSVFVSYCLTKRLTVKILIIGKLID